MSADGGHRPPLQREAEKLMSLCTSSGPQGSAVGGEQEDLRVHEKPEQLGVEEL